MTVQDIPIEHIMRMIPHRYPFLLIDRIKELHVKESAIGVKNVSMNEPHFLGHFPGHPIMPGVLIVEAMAQTAGALVVHSLDLIDTGKLVYFMTIDNTRFRKPVVPGDQLLLNVKVQRNRGNVWKFTGEATVEGAVVAQSDFSAMIIDRE
jgi:3-hydroxyacyl-[acyl-carrier-protein] dehydratase